MPSGASYEDQAAAAAIAKGHADQTNLRDLLIWTTCSTTAPRVEAYFREHREDATLLRELMKIALEGEDAGDAPWAAANQIAEFPAALLGAHIDNLEALSCFDWSYLRVPALKALAKLKNA